MATLWSSDGSSLAGWTVSGATVDATLGDPAPSFKATGGQYAYIAPVAGLVGKSILARVRVIPGGTPLCNLFFGCNASGGGQMLRLDTRGVTDFSGIATTTSWTAWGGAAATDVIVPTGSWVSVRIDIKAGPVADWYLDGVIKQSNVSIAVSGDYIAVHGDAGGVTGGNFDNLQILTPATVQGVVKIGDPPAPAARKVVLVRTSDLIVVGSAFSDAVTGEYSVEVSPDPGGALMGLAYPDYGETRAVSAAYAIGDRTFPAVPTGHWYECESAGTTGTTEPVWPTDGGTVTDGTVVWRDKGQMEEPIARGPYVVPLDA